MARNFFDNLPSTRTPITAPRMNALLDGDEPMGNIVVDSIKSKNILNLPNSSQTLSGVTVKIEKGKVITSGTFSDSLSAYFNLSIDLKGGTTYVLSRNQSPTNRYPYILLLDDNNNAIVTLDNATYKSFTPSNNVHVSKISFYINNSSGVDVTLYPQLEKGTEPTSYTPSQNLNIDISEGTWTPIIENANVTYDRQQGTYYKIGRLVNLTFRLQGTINSVTSPGYAFIDGVPFDAQQQAGSLYEYSNCFSNDTTPRTLRIINRELGIQDGDTGGSTISQWEAGRGTFYLSGTITYTLEN